MMTIRGSMRLVLGMAPLCLPLGAQAVNIVSNTVTGLTYPTLAEAVQALDADGQTLRVAPGVYTEADIEFRYAVTVRGEDAETTIVQAAAEPGMATTRIAWVNIPSEYQVEEPVILENLTLRHGRTTGNGGAILVQEGALLARHCIISNNIAGNDGGGLFAMLPPAASLIVEDSRIVRNTAAGNGGGMLRGRSVRTVMADNAATRGGGAAFAELDQCTIEDNRADNQGGGLHAVRATRCLIRRNQAGFGGAAGESDVANSVLIANTAVQRGGGLWGGQALNCTVVANSAGTEGGGIWGGAATNTIFHANEAPVGADYDATSVLSFCRSDPVAPGPGNVRHNPWFKDPAAGDYAIFSYSLCVDAGTNLVVLDGLLDFNGDPRIQGGTVDMGAFEADPSVDDGGFFTWASRYGIDRGDADPDIDRDGDGFTLWQEYVADTDPTDPASYLRFIEIERSDGQATLVWRGGHDARQIVETLEGAFGAGVWTAVITNFPATTLTNRFTVQFDGRPARFFRIRVER